MKSERELRQDIVEVGRRVWERGYVAANDGNISVRLSQDTVLATPTGVSKGFLTPEMLVKVDMEGNLLEGNLQPSSEIKLHLALYREREDVCGVVHAHPPTATGFAVAGIALDRPTLPELVMSLKSIPLAEYGTPSTKELPESIAPYVRDYDAFLLANHGVVTAGKDVYQAYYRLETVEHCAQISLAAKVLGREQTLTRPQVERLLELREQAGLEERKPCLDCGICAARETSRRFVETCSNPAASAVTQRAAQISDEELIRIVAQVTREVLGADDGSLDAVRGE